MLGKALDALESCNSRTRRFKIINKKICHRIDPVSSTYQPHSVLSYYYAVIFLLVPSCFFQGVSLPKFCSLSILSPPKSTTFSCPWISLLSDVFKSPICLLYFPLCQDIFLSTLFSYNCDLGGGGDWRMLVHKAENLAPFMCRLSENPRSLNLLESSEVYLGLHRDSLEALLLKIIWVSGEKNAENLNETRNQFGRQNLRTALTHTCR